MDYPTKARSFDLPDTLSQFDGIIGEISLHICDEIMIEHIKTYPDTEHKSVRVEITTNNTNQTQRNLSVCAEAELMDISGKTGVQIPAAYFQDIFFPVGKGTAEFTYELGEDAVLERIQSGHLRTALDNSGYRRGERDNIRSARLSTSGLNF